MKRTIRNGLMGLLAVSFVGTMGMAKSWADDDEEIVISADCRWYVGAECKLACKEFSYEAKCEAEVEIECKPHCDDFEIDVDCEASCQASCEAECEVEPGKFECEGYCQGECGAHCEGECETEPNAVACKGKCEAWCEGECSVGCEAEPAEVSCTGSCEASCSGQCRAEANIDCHLCDVDADIECSSKLTVDCEGGCDAEGVLECNGEFIDKKDIESAVEWVKENIGGEIYYEGEAECEGNKCTAEGSCEARCSVGAPQQSSTWGILALLVGVLILRRRI